MGSREPIIWDGVVQSVGASDFAAIVHCPEECIVAIRMSRVAVADRDRVVPGAIFRWHLDDGRLNFDGPVWTAEDNAGSKRRANALADALGIADENPLLQLTPRRKGRHE